MQYKVVMIRFWVFSLFLTILCIKGAISATSSLYQNMKNNDPEITDMFYPQEFKVASKLFPFSFNSDKYFDLIPYIFKHKNPNTPKEKPFYVEYEDFLRHELKNDWDIKRGFINVEQANLSIISAIGSLIPRLSLSIQTNPYTPIDLSQMFAGLFNFLIPSNWFNFFSALQMKKAARYSYIDLILTKNLLAKIGYIDAHRIKWEYLIHEIYAKSVLNFIHILENDPKYEDPIFLSFLKSYFFGLQTSVTSKIGALNGVLPELAQLGSYRKTEEINNFNIRPIPFPKMGGVEDLTPYPFEKKSYEHSLSLKVIKFTKRALNAQMGATFTGGIGVTGTIGAGATRSIGIDFGLDTVANGLIIRDDVRKIFVDYDEVKANIAASITIATTNYNRALICYRMTREGLSYQQDFLQKILINYKIQHKVVYGKFQRAVDQLINDASLMNACYHMMLISAVTLERFLVTPAMMDINRIYPEGNFKDF